MRLPYTPRPGQEEMGAAIEAAQKDGMHLLVEAGTGTGKTVVALSATLATTDRDARRLVYATRTNSQQSQVVAEHSALQDGGQQPGLLVPFMGRRQYCPLLRTREEFRDATPEELGRLCRDAKRKAQQQQETGGTVQGACPFYLRLLQDGPGPVEALLSSGGLDGGSLAARIEQAGSCPYEALKLLMPKARTVVVPYIFLLDDRLRATLLEWMGTSATECHLVVDEAHNLPDAARDHHSPRLTQATLQRAQKEAEEYDDPTLAKLTLTTSVLDAMLGALHDLADEHVRDGEDGLVPPDGLDEALMRRLRLPTPAIQRVATDLERWGETIREDRRAKGRLPRSYLGAIGAFLTFWMASRDEPYVQLVSGGENPGLEMFLLDPAAVLGWLGEFHSTTHMSGTLAPLDDHRTLCGLDASSTKQVLLPSAFPVGNLRIYGIEGVQRRFEAIQRDPSLVARQQETAREALLHCPGRTALFFPSHQMMRDYLEEGFLHGTGRPLFIEHAEASTGDLVRLVAAFKADPSGKSLLLGVLGGRLSEGMDFPGKAMEHLLVFGIPYPRPSARSQALIHHYDRKTGNGWQVAVHNPVGRTLRQAVGRLIRGPEDQGTAIILDDRVVRFHAHLKGLRMVADPREMQAPGSASDAGETYQTADRLPRKAPPGVA
ncbi:MAG TPA: ATP-dependent DNA helicase [Candidatus Thermoplasmatota archaeon]|nr:ATP-dependent DNA helicase [Candidatus Thermoplasmatota archaeon]